MSEDVRMDPVAYAKHKALEMVFEKEHDCFSNILDEYEKAMSRDKFVEVVSKLLSPNTNAKVLEMVEKLCNETRDNKDSCVECKKITQPWDNRMFDRNMDLRRYK